MHRILPLKNNMKNKHCFLLTLVFLFALYPGKSRAQVSPDPYVPCQEMPALIESFDADARAVTRFYNTSFYGSRNGGDRNAQGGSPGKREGPDQLYHEYLGKLERVDFNGLPQECKVDYILFKRDLVERLRASAEEAVVYNR